MAWLFLAGYAAAMFVAFAVVFRVLESDGLTGDDPVDRGACALLAFLASLLWPLGALAGAMYLAYAWVDRKLDEAGVAK